MAKYVDMPMEDLLNIFNFDSCPKQVDLYYQNREEWNGFILDDTAREVVNVLDDIGYNVIGFCDAPYPDNNFDKAIVLEDYENNYDIRWCHVSAYLIIQWRCSLTGEDYFDACEKYKQETGKEVI